MNDYETFIQSKGNADIPTGFDCDVPANPLFPFQAACVKWALKRGRAALFLDTGLGKTICQTTWAHHVCGHTGGNVIIAAPLCVAQQTVDEAAKFGIAVKYCRSDDEIEPGITITNYEILEHFDLESFAGVVLDESSILKGQSSKTRAFIVDAFRNTPYKLSCTATPSPNDYIELGNQAAFLGVMSAQEMLATFFTHDGADTSKWRLKNHGKVRFWEWMATWAICIRNPSDLGFDGSQYELPPLHVHEHVVSGGELIQGELLPKMAASLAERREAKRNSMGDRIAKVVEIVGDSTEPWIIWCHLNNEQDELEKLFGDRAFSVYGSLAFSEKERRITSWIRGERPIIISKQSIMGFGINAQFCNQMVFAGMDDSFEKYYQAVRRCYRFGQKKEVHAHLVVAETESAVKANIARKQDQANEMAEQMIQHMRAVTISHITGATSNTESYRPTVPMILPQWISSQGAGHAHM